MLILNSWFYVQTRKAKVKKTNHGSEKRVFFFLIDCVCDFSAFIISVFE